MGGLAANCRRFLRPGRARQALGRARGGPEITTWVTRLQLFAKYALQKSSGVRLDFIHDRFRTDDWTWTSWQYLDGITLVQDPSQNVNFLGASYYYRF
jgi:Putative outer membrane beta-barrel porin, MtrB/PioB